MSENTKRWALGLATGATGLSAGLFYSYACSVMPGLAHADDRTFLGAMQQINEAIQNPFFFVTFVGGPALTAWALITERRSGSRRILRWITAALVCAGVNFAITGAFNIPLNNELKAAGPISSITDLAHVRDQFEVPWVAWNVVRTLAATASFGCLVRALTLKSFKPTQSMPDEATRTSHSLR